MDEKEGEEDEKEDDDNNHDCDHDDNDENYDYDGDNDDDHVAASTPNTSYFGPLYLEALYQRGEQPQAKGLRPLCKNWQPRSSGAGPSGGGEKAQE